MTKRAFYFNRFFASAIAVLALSGCACSDSKSNRVAKYIEEQNSNSEIAMVTETDVKSMRKSTVMKAAAKLNGIKDNKVSGIVTFTKVPDGVRIVADVDGLKPGKHGFHIHEHGDCSGEDGMKAGGHFNPTNTKHGGPDSPERHVGDFGNLEADEKGNAHYDRVDALITFEGKNNIIGKSIIIHANEDDFVTQPTGNSGPRIGCGIIDVVH